MGDPEQLLDGFGSRGTFVAKYQGYLYSPSIPIDKLEEYICNEDKRISKSIKVS